MRIWKWRGESWPLQRTARNTESVMDSQPLRWRVRGVFCGSSPLTQNLARELRFTDPPRRGRRTGQRPRDTGHRCPGHGKHRGTGGGGGTVGSRSGGGCGFQLDRNVSCPDVHALNIPVQRRSKVRDRFLTIAGSSPSRCEPQTHAARDGE